MAAPIQTLSLDSHYSVFRRILLPRYSTGLGNGTLQVRRQWARPTYEFTVHDQMAVQDSAEYLYSFMAYHAGDIPFWWNGGPWGAAQSRLLVGFGDGTRTQYFLPNRYITPDTLTFYQGGLETALASCDWDAGLITLQAPAPDGVMLQAIYACTYKCVFWFDGEIVQTEEQNYASLFRYEDVTLREIVP